MISRNSVIVSILVTDAMSGECLGPQNISGDLVKNKFAIPCER